MSPRKKKSTKAQRRDSVHVSTGAMTVKGEGWGLPVAFMALVVIAAMTIFGIVNVTETISDTVRDVQNTHEPPVRPPPVAAPTAAGQPHPVDVEGGD